MVVMGGEATSSNSEFTSVGEVIQNTTEKLQCVKNYLRARLPRDTLLFWSNTRSHSVHVVMVRLYVVAQALKRIRLFIYLRLSSQRISVASIIFQDPVNAPEITVNQDNVVLFN